MMMNLSTSMFVPCLIAAMITFIRCSSQQTNKPHILFLLVDDLGWTDIGSHGAEYTTKNIDNLMETGVELTNYYVHLDCSPTRSAIMTGMYSFKNGLQSIMTIGPGTTKHIPYDHPTLPELLQKTDYRTHMLGKWHLGYAAWNMTPTERGFDTHYGYLQGAEDYYDHQIGNGYDFWMNQQVERVNNTYSTKLYQMRMAEILKDYNQTDKSNQLFVYMAFQTVHTPIQMPPIQYTECNDIKDGNRSIYCNKMQFLDNTIQEMIDMFKQYDLWNDTLLIFSTDNGGMPYWSTTINQLAASWGCNMPYRAGKATLFQGGVKGIGFVNGGDNVFPLSLRGTRSNLLTHAIDWLPTIVQGMLKQTLPDLDFDGMNMWNTLIGHDNDDDHDTFNRTTLFIDIETNGSYAGLIDGDYKYFQGQQLYTAYFPCNGSYVPYDNTSESQTEWLFNLVDDPFESNNIASSYPQLVNKYKAMIRDFIDNDGYMPEQDATFYKEAMPALHGGVWSPWLK